MSLKSDLIVTLSCLTEEVRVLRQAVDELRTELIHTLRNQTKTPRTLMDIFADQPGESDIFVNSPKPRKRLKRTSA